MGKLLRNKVVIIAFLMLVLLIPLSMISGLISERTFYREQVRQEIAQSWTGAQKVLGPFLVVPYSQQKSRREWDENLKQYKIENYTTRGEFYLLPDELSVSARVGTELRSRGLYSIPVYSSEMRIEGAFDNARLKELVALKGNNLVLGTPYLSVVVSDPRGVAAQPRLDWRGEGSRFISGSRLEKLESGIHAPVSAVGITGNERYPFSFELSLRGMERLELAPIGNTTQVSMEAAWPHPSFIGRFLPEEHTIDDKSFKAQWRVSSISSDMRRILDECASGNCNEFTANTFGVSLINPVDLYQQTERAVKYAILFILLTFVAFFLFEVMKPLRLHPMHYLLVGLALSLFYLLLISLSEHLPFVWAYLVAALASTLLIGFYVSGILGGKRRGTALAGALLLLYGMLFAILQSEDNALLMGSLLLFGVLGCVMVVSRKFDWYRIGSQETVPDMAKG